MKNVKTKKAMEVIRKYEEYIGETCQIFKGSPDGRYSERYFLYVTTGNGFISVGTYGGMIAYSKTLEGLLDLLDLRKTSSVVGVLSDSDLKMFSL